MTRSNSHPVITFDEYAVSARGVDTLSLAYPLADPEVHSVFAATEFGRGGVLKANLPEGVTLLQIGPDRLQIEGRASVMLSGDPMDRTLLSASDVVGAQDAIWSRVCRSVGRDARTTPRAATRRLDLSVDMAFGGGMGTTVIECGQALDLGPRWKVSGWQQYGVAESFAVHSARRRAVQLTVYDKGLERGGEQPGETIRFERRNRASGQRMVPLESVPSLDLGRLHAGALRPLLGISSVTRVVSPDEAIDLVLDAERRGDIRLGTADQLNGYIARRGRFVAVKSSESQADYRRRVKLRELGIVLGPPSSEPVELPLADVFRAAAASWT